MNAFYRIGILALAIFTWNLLPTVADANDKTKSHFLQLNIRNRKAAKPQQQSTTEIKQTRWNAQQTAIIICDMWDDHTCKAAAARVAEMAPAMNQTVKAARELGVLIIHAPSGRVSYYADTVQRKRAIQAPYAKADVKFQWNYRNQQRESAPLDFIRAGGCGCEIACPGWIPDKTGLRNYDRKNYPIPWTRQIDSIEIAAPDAISDNGQEIYNLLEQHKIKNVILMGVHTNLCVCGRPFGLRQMTYLKKNVVLCRDLTDSLFQPKTKGYNHFVGTEKIVQQIEQDICPTILSTDISSKPAFVFQGAKHAP